MKINTRIISTHLAIVLLLLTGCGGGGGGGGNNNNNESADPFYEPLTAEYANQRMLDAGFTVDFQLVHTDGLENSELDIADLNIVMMDRAANGDIFLSYDAYIYSHTFSSFMDPDAWAGSSSFNLYIDNDNDANTGFSINGIGADIQLTSLGQNVWNPATDTWDSTWFEVAPPPGGIRVSGASGYIVTVDIFDTGEAYIRVERQLKYLDALMISTSAKAVLQIVYYVDDPVLLIPTQTSLDTTASFEMPDF